MRERGVGKEEEEEGGGEELWVFEGRWKTTAFWVIRNQFCFLFSKNEMLWLKNGIEIEVWRYSHVNGNKIIGGGVGLVITLVART